MNPYEFFFNDQKLTFAAIEKILVTSFTSEVAVGIDVATAALVIVLVVVGGEELAQVLPDFSRSKASPQAVVAVFLADFGIVEAGCSFEDAIS